MNDRVAAVVIVVLVFFVIRCTWLAIARFNYLAKLGHFVKNKNKENIPQFCEMYFNVLWQRWKMIFAVWIWDLKRMVYDKEKFDEVMNQEE
jgi:hypothetical protein